MELRRRKQRSARYQHTYACTMIQIQWISDLEGSTEIGVLAVAVTDCLDK